jgi:nucleotide-binding universal stress UspA family protein
VLTCVKHILAATDLSERSQRAFERAAQLSREMQATLAVMHVVEAGLVAAVRERRHALAEEYLREWLAKLAEADRACARFNVESGEPFTIIIEQVRKRGADLIVVGEPGKRGLKELFIGTTTERDVRHSDRPVLVVKQPTKHAYRRVLVAVDFSEGALRAFEAAFKIAPNAGFLLVYAWQVPAVGFGSLEAAEKATAWENELLRKRLEHLVFRHIYRIPKVCEYDSSKHAKYQSIPLRGPGRPLETRAVGCGGRPAAGPSTARIWPIRRVHRAHPPRHRPRRGLRTRSDAKRRRRLWDQDQSPCLCPLECVQSRPIN